MQNLNEIELLNCRGEGYNGLRGQMLQNRYVIGDFIAKGYQGKIYSVVDVKKDSKKKTALIIKISENC